MSQPLQPGNQPGAHPDADQINTFVEGVGSAHQREQMLTHLAECGECRDLVFLLQNSAAPEPAAAMGSAVRTPRHWFLPLGLAGAALACGLTALVYVRVHRTPSEQPQVAAEKPAPAPHVVTPLPPAAVPPANRRATMDLKQPRVEVQPGQRQRAEAKAQRDSAQAATGMNALEQPAPPPSPAAPAAGPAAPPAVSPGAAAKASAPATETASAGLKKEATNEPSVAVAGRNFAALALPRPTPALRIEHDRGPADGKSEIAGRVTDMSGAVIAGAEVALRNGAGATCNTTTDAAGRFSLTGVAPGHYNLSVTARGFERTQQAMDLQPRDLAELDTVLPVGAATEAVTVEAEQNSVQTQQAPMSDAAGTIVGILPSGMPAASRVVKGKRVLSLDAAGTLFLSRNGGKSWKKVKPVWTGKVTQLALADQAAQASAEADLARKTKAAGGPQMFQITTDGGSVWISDDGVHWHPR